MAKFALECPHCGTVNRASTFIFAKKVITCGNCKGTIDVKANRVTVGNCKKCGSVAYDQAKGTCPICKGLITVIDSKKVSSAEEIEDRAKDGGTPLFLCPECHCNIQVVDEGHGPACPVCDHKFNGYQEIFGIIQRSKLVNDTGVSVIKYEGDNQTFVWKHPIEDFNMGSQLIVHEAQEAIFVLNGKAMDLFGPGKYTLETEKFPLLNKVYDMPTGKQNSFHSEVYFINRTVQMGLKWGTPTRINIIEPETGIPLAIGAFGELNLEVSDSRRLLVKLVGSKNGIAWESDSKNFTKTLQDSFRPLITTTIKSTLAAAIKEERINILEIDSRLEDLSAAVGKKVSEGFEEYGLSVPQFYISNVDLPETDPNFRKIRDLLGQSYLRVREAEINADVLRAEGESARIKAHTEADVLTIGARAAADATTMQGLAEAEVMRAKGYTERDVLQADVQKAYAQGIGQMGANGGGAGGGMMSDIIGLGVSMAAMGAVGDKVGGAMRGMDGGSTTTQTTSTSATGGWKCSCGCDGNTGKFCSECGKAKPELWDCPSCGATGNKGKFCSECGKAKPESWDCPSCGAKGNKGKFCSECGSKKEDN